MINDKEKNFISVVAYVHNSSEQIEKWLTFAKNFLEKYFNKYEIIFVDDNSTDGSADKIKKWAKENQFNHMINIITMSYYHGMELSMAAGVDLSIGDFVYEFDSLNIDYDKEMPWTVYEKSLEGFDITSAVPNDGQDLLSTGFYKLYNWSKRGESQYQLVRETFRLLSRRAINRVHAISDTMPYRKAQYLNCGLPCAQLFYNPTGNTYKKYDKVQKRNRREIAVESLILFTDLVTKCSMFISSAFLFFALLTGGYTVYSYFGVHKPIEGWAPIMGFLAAGFAGVFIVLTVIVKYLSMVLNMIFKKQNYLIKNIEKITR